MLPYFYLHLHYSSSSSCILLLRLLFVYDRVSDLLKRPKRTTCRCGEVSKKEKSVPKRQYKSLKRCRCLRQYNGCSNYCKCSGHCGGKVCKTILFSHSKPKKEKSKKRAKHVLQRPPTKLTSSDSSKNFKMNFLEACFLSAIILHLENRHGNNLNWAVESVNEIYTNIIMNLLNFGIVLPLNRWSIGKMQKEMNKLKKYFDSKQ